MLKKHIQQGLYFMSLLFLSLIFSLPSSFAQDSKTKTLKVLAIGNSFSDDAIEHHLYGLAKAQGKEMVIGNLYIGGAALTLHWKNAEANIDAYEYRKISIDGSKTKKLKTSIESALADEDWDVVSFQQASPLSGDLASIQAHLPQLYNYVKNFVEAKHSHAAGHKKTKTTYVFHQTWAYSPNSTHAGFANYENNQLQMYEKIAQASKQIKRLVPIDAIIPAGTAIQNARQTELGDNLTRDGYHLEHQIGKYIAACTWFEMLFKTSVIGNTYRSEKISERQALIAQKAAHKAVKKPFKLSLK